MWAPETDRSGCASTAGTTRCERGDDGWWRLDVPSAGPGTDYAFLLPDDDTALPDPRSTWQPAGVHGPSRVYDHARLRLDRRRLDRPAAARQRSSTSCTSAPSPRRAPSTPPSSASTTSSTLGVDLVELLPVNAFNGEHNWGYDGVCWYAPHEPYGGPDGLKRFVDACHRRGLGVVLDVVYNHFGPSGAYAPMFAPYLTRPASNPWGALGQPRRPARPTRSAATSSTARCAGCATTTSTGCGWTPCTRWSTTSAVHLLEQLAVEVEACRRTWAGRCR